jgi:hypothetical protein
MKKLIGMFEASFPKKKTMKRVNQIGKTQLSTATKLMFYFFVKPIIYIAALKISQ